MRRKGPQRQQEAFGQARFPPLVTLDRKRESEGERKREREKERERTSERERD